MSTRTETSTVYLQHCGKSVSPLPIALLCFGFCIFVKNLFDHQTNFNIRKLFMNASIFYHLSGFGSQAWAEMPRISIYRYIERYSLYIKMYNIFFLIKSVPGYEKWSLEEEIKSLTWVCIMWFFFFCGWQECPRITWGRIWILAPPSFGAKCSKSWVTDYRFYILLLYCYSIIRWKYTSSLKSYPICYFLYLMKQINFPFSSL